MYNPELNKIDGFMTNDELLWLYKTAKEMDSVVELGSWKGRSAHALLAACSGPVYCVDHFLGTPNERESCHKDAKTMDIFALFQKNVGNEVNLNIHRGDTVGAAQVLPDVDMVFVDADHTYEAVKADILAWLPKCKKLLCGHDYDQASIPKIAQELNLDIKKTGVGALWELRIKCDLS